MRDALNKTGRPIFYSICNWGDEDTPSWAPKTGNSWRTTGDIANNWSSMKSNFDRNYGDRKASGPGGWNDPDMLEIGVTRDKTLSIDEEKTHFALWAISKAPLIIGADLRSIKKESLDILMNKELIAVNQDPNSYQAVCPFNQDPFASLMCLGEVGYYATTMSDGSKVVAVTNFHDYFDSRYAFVTLHNLDMKLEKGQRAIITDLYDPTFEASVEAAYKPIWAGTIKPHASRVLKIKVDHIQEEQSTFL
jgi:hypothetical protein